MVAVSRCRVLWLVFSAGLVGLGACAGPAPTATPTQPVAAPTKVAPTPTKAPTATPTKRPVTNVEVAQPSVTTLVYSPGFVAKEKGYFLEEGLNVDWVIAGSGAKSLAAVVGRSAPIGIIAAPDVTAAVGQGQPARAFAQVGQGNPFWEIISKEIADRRSITAKMTLEEKGRAIKGLSFATTSPGSGTDYALRYFLRKAGLDPDRDVEITYVGSSAAYVAAFQNRSVDGVSATAGQVDILLSMERGEVVMLVDYLAGDVPGTADMYYQVAVGHRDELERQPGIFEAYTVGLWRGMRFIVEHEAEAREVVRKAYFPDLDQALYQKSWDLLRPVWVKEPTLRPEGLRATLDYRNATEPPPPLDVRFEDFGTNKFVETAKKQLGF
ncbi:MAG: ABC transporter substrate-binding protein [Chloroflexi bacterium]|nr:ABC transporter substrate-binding protein [Chloroflexota bacterium]